MEGKFRIKEQIGGKMFYSNIWLEVEFQEGEGYEVVEYEWNKIHSTSINFAVEYFYTKKVRYSIKKKMVVKVTEIHFMPVDTTLMVVFYGIIKALENATGLLIEDVRINENGNFVFPK